LAARRQAAIQAGRVAAKEVEEIEKRRGGKL
jgi:hypothetical protein